jgi:hypothetical protein
MNPPDDPRPCDLQDGDQFFQYKAGEFAGSIRQWDEIVNSILALLPLYPREIGQPHPAYLNQYQVRINAEVPLLLTYRVIEDAHLLPCGVHGPANAPHLLTETWRSISTSASTPIVLTEYRPRFTLLPC